ncbi:MAG: PmoA family protein [Puniceicoccales bacterium]|jgi:hypothetical protein|nr:PmoA family protein [Puniceicoccales bacterium]
MRKFPTRFPFVAIGAAALALAVSSAAFAGESSAKSAASLTVEKVAAPVAVSHSDNVASWVISEGATPVLRYNYATVALPEGYYKSLHKSNRRYAVARSNYIHPLYDLEGKEITADWNRDHPHHRGIYWAWPEVICKSSAGKPTDLHALQEIFARPTGKLETIQNADGSLSLTAENLWFWKNKEAVVTELVKITVFPRSANERKINLEFHFTALQHGVTIARRQTKHYGGLNIRMAKLPKWKSFSFPAKKTAAPAPAWTGASWERAGTNTRSEFVVFENAANPDYPGDFITYPNLNWFQPTFPAHGKRFPLKKDETLVLRYQLWINNGASSDEQKKQRWEQAQR